MSTYELEIISAPACSCCDQQNRSYLEKCPDICESVSLSRNCESHTCHCQDLELLLCRSFFSGRQAKERVGGERVTFELRGRDVRLYGEMER